MNTIFGGKLVEECARMQQSGDKIPTMDGIEDSPSGNVLPSLRSNREWSTLV